MTTSRAETEQICVRVTLFADLRRFLAKGQEGPQQFVLPAGTSIGTLLDQIGIPAEDETTAGLNGELAQRDTTLKDGDDLVLFSPMEGG